ncbi:hypothetical protein D9M71_652070 [compost metagenome]
MAHETADDQVQVPILLQGFMQGGVFEGIGHALFDDHFIALRFKAWNELTAWPLWVEQTTDGAKVAHVDDRAAGLARRFEHFSDVRHSLVHARQRQRTAQVLFLRVDNDQAGIAELGGWIATAAKVEHRRWNRHQGLLWIGLFNLLSPA